MITTGSLYTYTYRQTDTKTVKMNERKSLLCHQHKYQNKHEQKIEKNITHTHNFKITINFSLCSFIKPTAKRF